MIEELKTVTVEDVLEKLNVKNLSENDGILIAIVQSTDDQNGEVKMISSGMTESFFIGLAQTLMKFVLKAYQAEDVKKILGALLHCHSAFLGAAGSVLNEIEEPGQYRAFAEAVHEYLGRDLAEEDDGEEEQDTGED